MQIKTWRSALNIKHEASQTLLIRKCSNWRPSCSRRKLITRTSGVANVTNNSIWIWEILIFSTHLLLWGKRYPWGITLKNNNNNNNNRREVEGRHRKSNTTSSPKQCVWKRNIKIDVTSETLHHDDSEETHYLVESKSVPHQIVPRNEVGFFADWRGNLQLLFFYGPDGSA